jgi:hypothetical protein
MNEAAVRASLQYSTAHEVVDPDGHQWTIRMRRTTDPVNEAWDSWRWSAMLIRRLGSRLHKDTSWYVEVMSSTQQNWDMAHLLGTDPSRPKAIERVVATTHAIATGSLDPADPRKADR